ncbi:preprotein translocase subunit SecG [Rubrivirga sp. S365]|uniref:Protein-export membrane protein SecG n=1 Tax=Rubrivirga litoralis TaxID=3075598 RepID=A0ABU3BML8_9BACT|nr:MULTISPECIES: preprotein translocase subunit SecG [unclassified Rubrivirga]MDT0630508.1 preprotein translocase subunit SecG [Rubrivirga sp. F394]MDT7856877.1 preprotein translocase subunit SecG [Rubrivirga sp. S365]
MTFFYILVAVILLVALLMALVVLLQSGKGGGLAGIASGGQTTQILGARQAPDFLERATWSLGATFLVLCVITTFFIPRVGGAGESILQERAGELPVAPAPIDAPLPEAPVADPATPMNPDVRPGAELPPADQ